MKALHQLMLEIAPETEEPIAALFEHHLGGPPVVSTDQTTGRTFVRFYAEQPRGWFLDRLPLLLQGLKELKRLGFPSYPETLRLEVIPKEDWAETWKRHFRPQEYGRALLIRPTWSRRQPKRGQAVVVLDPGLSFGTGQHPTTAFCLQQIVRWRRQTPPRSFLDLGTGSGILSIAAAKLGYKPVYALDYDPQCIRSAHANARHNRVAGPLRLQHQDIRRLSAHPRRRFELICANLLADLLVREAERIVSRLHPAGTLVLAGILESQFAEVESIYGAAGLRTVEAQTIEEWRSGAFQFKTGESAKSTAV